MKAMILAAGLGTRLGPLTSDQPKALVKVAGKPMLQWVIEKLKQCGVDEIIINVHHFADQVQDFLRKNDFGPAITISDESPLLLDTGGGLKKASWFFSGSDPFILHNVDVLSTIDLHKMAEIHKKSGALATLAVSVRTSSRYFLFDEGMNLSGWENTTSQEVILSKTPVHPPVRYAFSGIHVINPEIFKFIEEEERFSMVDVYVRLANNHIIKGYCHSPDHWIDMGRMKDIEKAEEMIRRGVKI